VTARRPPGRASLRAGLRLPGVRDESDRCRHGISGRVVTARAHRGAGPPHHVQDDSDRDSELSKPASDPIIDQPETVTVRRYSVRLCHGSQAASSTTGYSGPGLSESVLRAAGPEPGALRVRRPGPGQYRSGRGCSHGRARAGLPAPRLRGRPPGRTGTVTTRAAGRRQD
jgi:hypothetical protein